MGASALAGYRADTMMARAAGEANVPFILSGSSLIPCEEIIEANPSAWFQGYVAPDSDEIGGLADRVWTAGFRTFVLTVDVPVGGNRENNVRAGFSHPLRPTPQLTLDALRHPKWLVNTWLRTRFKHGMPHFENLSATRGIPILSRTAQRSNSREGLNWDDYKFLRDRWKGNLVVKGILDPADARIAREMGADGIVVSNHGGRQLDGSIAPLKALESVLTETGDMTVLFDGGIRRGTDVIKALALGAQFVFVGRPMLYSAALGEHAGVAHAIALLKQEINRDMALLGCNSLSEFGARIVRP
jgi:L-lactate dehydrogenase (cytochrome)